MGKPELIQALRTQIGSVTARQKEYWKAPEIANGVARGILAELRGNARAEWLIQLFVQNPEHFIYWCEREVLINPTAIHQRGVDLRRIKFLTCGGDLHQPIRLALETKSYPFVVAPNVCADTTAYQRLSLLAEKANSTIFLLSGNGKSFSNAWPISLQLDINHSGVGFSIEIQRQRHTGEA